MFYLTRRNFLKSSTVFLGSLAAQQLISNKGISVVSAQANLRPFRMLTLGDSVLGGQGLLEENKFSFDDLIMGAAYSGRGDHAGFWPEADKCFCL